MSSVAIDPAQADLLDASLANWLSKDVILNWQAGATLNAGLLQSASQTTAKPQQMLRCWGQTLNQQLLTQLLDQLVEQLPTVVAQISLYQPHPQLAGAVSIALSEQLSSSAVEALRQWAAMVGVELNVLHTPVLLSEPGVLVMDMDSTAITIECIDEIAKLAGTGEQVAAVTAAAMRGELDFAESLRQRVATLAGAPESVLAQVLAQLPLMPGLAELVDTLQQRQWSVAIASGGFTYFTKALQQQLGLTATFANELEINQGVLTGQVVGAIVDANTKATVVGRLAAQRQIPRSQTVAIGDGANDLPMLAEAGLGVAFHAKPLVQAKASHAIRQGSLLQLLYLLEQQDWRQ